MRDVVEARRQGEGKVEAKAETLAGSEAKAEKGTQHIRTSREIVNWGGTRGIMPCITVMYR